jgi:NAD(P)-dependent dehydrogenase (short-subunit alcohol dehydrogenase family)
VFGPAEAFTPEQLAQLYDVNVLSTQRVNRAVLPHLRRQKQGLLVWVSSSSSAGGTPPYLAPYFAAKAGMDAMAVVYARELTRWGIETSIIVPGAFTAGTNHFAHSGRPHSSLEKEAVRQHKRRDGSRAFRLGRTIRWLRGRVSVLPTGCRVPLPERDGRRAMAGHARPTPPSSHSLITSNNSPTVPLAPHRARSGCDTFLPLSARICSMSMVTEAR